MADKKGYDKLKQEYPGMDIDYALLQSPAGRKFGGRSLDDQYEGLQSWKERNGYKRDKPKKKKSCAHKDYKPPNHGRKRK